VRHKHIAIPDDEPIAYEPGCTYTEHEQSSNRAAWKSAAEILLRNTPSPRSVVSG
jgi:hypothetical protein